MINKKLIKARKAMYTQESIAKILHMTQSQYQRRETGEIKISDEEWERIAKALNTIVEEIKEDHLSLIHNHDTVSNNYLENNQLYNIPDFILKNQSEYIALLKEEIEELKEEIKNLKSPNNFS